MAAKKTETERYLEQKIRELKEGLKEECKRFRSQRNTLRAYLRCDFDSFLRELPEAIDMHATLREYKSAIGDLEEDLHNMRAGRA